MMFSTLGLYWVRIFVFPWACPLLTLILATKWTNDLICKLHFSGLKVMIKAPFELEALVCSNFSRSSQFAGDFRCRLSFFINSQWLQFSNVATHALFIYQRWFEHFLFGTKSLFVFKGVIIAKSEGFQDYLYKTQITYTGGIIENNTSEVMSDSDSLNIVGNLRPNTDKFKVSKPLNINPQLMPVSLKNKPNYKKDDMSNSSSEKIDYSQKQRYHGSHGNFATGEQIISMKINGKPIKLKITANRKYQTSIEASELETIEKIKDDIKSILPRANYDDGSLGPIIVRLAWHCCATYDMGTNTGGSNGGTMRFVPEISDEGNTGLDIARAALYPIKLKYPQITHSDLWTLAGVVAISEMGGPQIEWKCGRYDCENDEYVPPNGRLPFADKGINHVRETFSRMGFNDQEAVALLGTHALGRCHKRYSGWEGKWTSNPIRFSNEFYKVLISEDWSLGEVPETGRKQYYNKDKSLMMLNTDMVLLQDINYKTWVQKYATDEERFFHDYSRAFAKLLELGIERDVNGKVALKKNALKSNREVGVV